VPSLGELFPVQDPFQRHIIDAGVRSAAMVLVAFLVTFCIVRAITHAIRRGAHGVGNVSVGGIHVHHMVPGILLLLISGFIAIGVEPDLPDWLWWLLPTLFGIGAALTLDEFALWLDLKDVYWSAEGRRSVDAVIVAATILGIIALGARFWVTVIREATPTGTGIILAYHVLCLASAAVCVVKGRYVLAALALLLWPIGLWGALRLAHPRSLWAHRRYDPATMARAEAREGELRRAVERRARRGGGRADSEPA
jgi:hypothetical protein